MYIFQDHPITSCYSWGSTDTTSIQATPKRITIPSSCPIDQVFAGKNQTTVAISCSGEAYSWGSGNIGRVSTIKSIRDLPHKVKMCQKVHSCSLGEDHGMLLDIEGNVYAFGSSSEGKIGISNLKRDQIITTPKKVDIKGRCVVIACGQSTSTLVVVNSAESIQTHILMYGRHGFQSRSGIKKNRRMRYDAKPLKFQFQSMVSSLSSGSNHVLAVVNQRLFGWGSNDNGRLAQKKLSTIISEPIEIVWFSEKNILIDSVAAGSAHSIVLSEDRSKVYAFGWNLYHQCGNYDQENILEPTILQLSNGIRSVHSGFAHNAAITLIGELFCWGFNEEGQCGLGHERNVPHPSLVEFPEDDTKIVVSVALGSTHTIALTSNLSLSEYLQRKNQLTIINRASSVICRFFRFALLQIRLKLLIKGIHHDHKDDCESSNTSEHMPEQDLVCDQLDQSDSTLYSDSSLNDGLTESYPSVNTSVIAEIVAMQEEDEHSQLYSQELNKLYQERHKARLRIILELTRRFEMACMCKEDLMASYLRGEKRASILRRREESLQKRLLKPRNQIPKVQPKMTHRCSNNKLQAIVRKSFARQTPRKPHLLDRIPSQFVEDNSKNSIIELNRKRNELLLRRRDARLKKKKDDEDRKMKQRMKDRLKDEQEKLLDKEKELLRIELVLQNMKTNLDIQKRYSQSMLSDLKHSVSTKKTIFDPIQLTSLKSVREWTKELESDEDMIGKSMLKP